MKLRVQKILWPTDFSPLSLVAAETACDLAQTFKAELHLVHVAPVLVGGGVAGVGYVDDHLVSAADVRGVVGEQLTRLSRERCPVGLTVVRDVLLGTSWDQICQYAKDTEIDLIVMATHGRAGLRHALMGSVTERVIQHAPCMVLVVKSFALKADA